MPPDDDQNAGGLGGESAPGVRDTRLYEKAIRERWPMSPAVRVKVLKRLCKVADEDAEHAPLPPPGHREVIAASRALLSADKLNLEFMRFEAESRAAEDNARDALIEAEAADAELDRERQEREDRPAGPEVPG